MTTTAAQRTAAHAAFIARRETVSALLIKHGADCYGNFKTDVACEAFYSDLAAYDARHHNPCRMVVDQPGTTKISLKVDVTFHGHEVDPRQILGLVQDDLEQLRVNGSLSIDGWYDNEATAETSCDSVVVTLASI